MKKSLEACQKIFEINIDNIVSNKYESNYVELFNTAFTYKDVARLCVETEPGKLIKATNFGAFKAFSLN